MAALYDLEDVLNDVETFLKANLNTAITAINTEKNDDISLTTLETGAYFRQTLNDAVVNYDPFVVYGIQEITTTGIGPSTSDRITVVVAIAVVDSGQDLWIINRLLRYARALRTIFNSNFDKISSNFSLKTSVTLLPPQPFVVFDSNADHKAVGIQFDINLS